VAVESAPYHLFAGEETASVAFGAMLRALPAGARVYGAVEVAGQDDRLPLPRAAELCWRFRGDAPAVSSASLVSAVRDLDLPAEPGVAYLAGGSPHLPGRARPPGLRTRLAAPFRPGQAILGPRQARPGVISLRGLITARSIGLGTNGARRSAARRVCGMLREPRGAATD